MPPTVFLSILKTSSFVELSAQDNSITELDFAAAFNFVGGNGITVAAVPSWFFWQEKNKIIDDII